jgi:hypothetical protein
MGSIGDKIGTFMSDTVIGTIGGIYSLIPDSILFGSILLYFLTQNIAFGVFAVFIFETVLAHKGLAWVYNQKIDPIEEKETCSTGYKTVRFSADRMFLKKQRPSYGIFSIFAIGLYLGLATNSFSETFDRIDKMSTQYSSDWTARPIVAYTFIGIVLFLSILARIIMECDTKSDIIVAVIGGIITGIFLFYGNKAIFGEESMNFLGLPYIVSKEKEGSPIYICAATSN